jgi:hypothetical protein
VPVLRDEDELHVTSFRKKVAAFFGYPAQPHSVGLALDIDSGRVITVLILGGTKRLLNGDYSRSNVETVGRAEFARWGGRGINTTERLNACIARARPN